MKFGRRSLGIFECTKFGGRSVGRFECTCFFCVLFLCFCLCFPGHTFFVQLHAELALRQRIHCLTAKLLPDGSFFLDFWAALYKDVMEFESALETKIFASDQSFYQRSVGEKKKSAKF